jgi:hypothetical protein
MTFDTNTWLLVWGGGLITAGLAIWWWTSRYDLKEAAIESAWQLARGRRTAENPTAIEEKLREIGAEATVAGKATRAARTVAGHFFAQVMGLVAIVMMLGGAVLAAAGWFWR